MALTVHDLETRGLLRELAKVFRTEDAADGLLASIRVPPESRPSFRGAGNSLNYWRSAAEIVESGITEGCLEALLAAAAKMYPYNSAFAPWRAGAPTSVPSSESKTSPASSPASRSKAPDPPTSTTKQGKPRPWVFLCHGSEDKPKVRELYQRLKGDGLQPWLDEEDILPGEVWEVAIRRAMKGSHAVIVCLSQSAIEKVGYVQKEIRIALDIFEEQPEGAIFLIPARLEECEIPQRLAHVHWVDLFREGGYEKLLRALRAHTV